MTTSCDDAARYASDLISITDGKGAAPPRPVFYGGGSCSGQVLSITKDVFTSIKIASAFVPAYMVLTATYSGGPVRTHPPNGRTNASGYAADMSADLGFASVKLSWSFQAPFDSETGWMRDMCMGEQYEVERDQPLIQAWKPGSKECDVFMLQQCTGAGAANDPACACIIAARDLARIGPVQCLSRACASSGYRTKAMLAPCTFTECDQIRNVNGDAVVDVTGELFCGGKIYNLGEGATPDDIPPDLLPLRIQPADPKTHSQALMITLMVLLVILVIGLGGWLTMQWRHRRQPVAD
jgi:hypothetical protein